MFKSKLSKILGLVALFLLIIFSWVYVKDLQKKKVENTPVYTGIENPFGGETQNQSLPSTNTVKETSPNSNSVVIPPTATPSQNITIIEEDPALKQFSNEPIAGFTFASEDRVIETSDALTSDTTIVETYDFSGYKTLRFGDKADEIVKIKTVLNRQTPSPTLNVNTEYDTDMKNAVIEFQNTHGLSGDAVIGSKTYAKLNEFQGITKFSSTKKPDNIETVELIRYVKSASGIMFDKAVRKNEAEKTITRTSVPRVVEAFFDNTGERAVFRYLKDDTIETYLVNLTFPKIDLSLPKAERDALQKIAAVTGEFLPENIKTISISRDGKNLFYFNPIQSGVAGITYNFVTKAKKEIWRTPITEWIADWGSESKINLTTKASGRSPGYSYNVDAKTGALSRNIGGNLGLTTLLSPDGKKLLYSEYKDRGIATYVLDIATQKVSSISPSTLPEKCVWAKDSTKIYCAGPVQSATKAMYPDDWYKGKISFDDAIWMVDMTDYSGNIIFDIVAKSGKRIDAINLQLNKNGDYLGFIDKKTENLWGYDLTR